MNLNAKQHRLHLQWKMQRTKIPEKLLAPHYLNNSSVFKIGMRVAISHHQCHIPEKNLDNLKNVLVPLNECPIASDIDTRVSEIETFFCFDIIDRES